LAGHEEDTRRKGGKFHHRGRCGLILSGPAKPARRGPCPRLRLSAPP